mmetsp:Transcript_61059/g.180662  ORF Transcript_61059/g.180662 Transcript_61059/m.180662 type:complete len:205 (-) Transcript_61059:92-706(-)
MRGVEEISVCSSANSDAETQDEPEVISAVYGIADAERYCRHSSLAGPKFLSANECLSVASSEDNTRVEGFVSNSDRIQCTLGISSRRLFKLESIMKANSILFSMRKKDGDGDDENDLMLASWEGQEGRVRKRIEVSGKDWCCLCLKRGGGTLPAGMKRCACGRECCDKWAHVICIHNRSHTQSLSHTSSMPPPALPNFLCTTFI